MMEGKTEKNLAKKDVGINCLAFFCMSLYTLYGAMTVFISIFQPYREGPWACQGMGHVDLNKQYLHLLEHGL